MSMASAAQRSAGAVSCSYTTGGRSIPQRLAHRPFQPRHRCRRRGHRAQHIVQADLLPPELFSDALAPIADAVPFGILDTVSDILRSAVGGLIAISPQALQPVFKCLGTDVVTTAELQPSSDSVLRLAAIWFAFFSQPAPAIGLLDFYIVGPLVLLAERKWSTADLTLRDRMGGGNFGQVFEGVQNVNGERNTDRVLADEDKRRRVVLKRVNLDTVGVRTDFLRSGTVARGAAESGKVEQYVCSRLSRNPLAQASCAKYLGEFTAEASEYGFTKGTQWLVWKYESDSTLYDALMGNIGRFPACLAPFVTGSNGSGDEGRRDAAVVKAVMRKVLTALARMHRVGIVHRDVKPDNILVTNTGAVKLIDFGAAVDMCTGINFNPRSGMLDPRYSPPEELVMPEKTPRAPLPAVAILLAPFTWLYGRPDLFDSYSAGILLLQLAVPELRSAGAVRNLNIELGYADFDLDAWRYGDGSPYSKAKAFDFAILDRSGGAGWDLARKLTRKRNGLNRGRISAGQALRHRYFLPFT